MNGKNLFSIRFIVVSNDPHDADVLQTWYAQTMKVLKLRNQLMHSDFIKVEKVEDLTESIKKNYGYHE